MSTFLALMTLFWVVCVFLAPVVLVMAGIRYLSKSKEVK